MTLTELIASGGRFEVTPLTEGPNPVQAQAFNSLNEPLVATKALHPLQTLELLMFELAPMSL